MTDLKELITISFHQPSILELVSNYLSLVPNDLINLHKVFPTFELPQRISDWDVNLQKLLTLNSVQFFHSYSNEKTWLISEPQGVKYFVKFNSTNKNNFTMFIQSLEFPKVIKFVQFKWNPNYQYRNSDFYLEEIPVDWTTTNKRELFLISCDSFWIIDTEDTIQESISIKVVIRVTDLNNIESFFVPISEFRSSFTKDNVSNGSFETHKLNDFWKNKLKIKYAFSRLSLNVYVGFSNTGKSFFISSFNFPLTLNIDGKIVMMNKTPTEWSQRSQTMGFLDDDKLIWFNPIDSNANDYYLTNINNGSDATTQKLFTLAHSSLLLIGGSSILIISQKDISIDLKIFNVETKQFYKIPRFLDYGKVKKVYVTGPGIFKFNHSNNSTLLTFDAFDIPFSIDPIDKE